MNLPTDLEIDQNLVPVRIAVLEATRTTRSPRRSTRFRTTRNVVIAAVAIAALTGGAFAVSRALQNTIDHSAICYEHPSLDSYTHEVVGAGLTSDDPLDPVEFCAQVWRDGWFTPDHRPDGQVHPVPDLTACMFPDSTAGVFPREGRPAEDFCETLGLADWDSD